MGIDATINNFYDSVKHAANCLKNYTKEIDQKQEKIKEYIDKIDCFQESLDSGEDKMRDLCNQIIFQYNKELKAWKKVVDKYVSGKQFVNQFEKSLLLIVFADVKAGKSTLGNFISGYAFKDTSYCEFFSQPQYYAYDYTDKSLGAGIEKKIPEGHFIEDEIQATASIQYFTLHDGLTWVDTPGIHSLTSEYEELAKDYVKYADLILFLTPSNNPCKMDEAYEIKKLIQQDKPLLVAITKSDQVKKGVIDGKIYTVVEAKSKENRRQQEQYVEAEINKMGKESIISQNRYISISTKLAVKAMQEQNENLFEESNFPEFFAQIGAIVSEKTVDLKMKRPKDELNLVIDELVHGNAISDFVGIEKIIQNLEEVYLDIEEQKNRLGKVKTAILSEVQAEISNRVYAMLLKEKNSGKLGEQEYISKKVNEIVEECMESIINDKLSSELGGFQKRYLNTADITVDANFETKTQTIEYQVQEGRECIRDPKGIIEHLQSFFFDKEFTEYSVRTKTRTRTIEVGDNFHEYAQMVWNTIHDVLEEQVNMEIEKVKAEYFGNLLSKINEMKSEIEKMQNNLLELKY